MFTAMLAKAKLLALAGIIGGGAAYATHEVSARPAPQDQGQQWQDQNQADPGSQNPRDQQRQPFGQQDFNRRSPGRQDLNRSLNRRIDQQVDRHLASLACQPRHSHFDRPY